MEPVRHIRLFRISVFMTYLKGFPNKSIGGGKNWPLKSHSHGSASQTLLMAAFKRRKPIKTITGWERNYETHNTELWKYFQLKLKTIFSICCKYSNCFTFKTIFFSYEQSLAKIQLQYTAVICFICSEYVLLP